MTRYLVVAAVRIQTWISRTPRLRLNRGASAALTTTTGDEQVDGWLRDSGFAGRVRRAHDAAQIDGVIALEVMDAIDEDGFIDALTASLGLKLPAVEWRAWAADGESYLAAHLAAEEAQARGGAPGVLERRLLPAALGVSYAESCGGCRLEAAVCTVEFGDGSDKELLRLGPDCHSRFRTRPTTALGEQATAPREFKELSFEGGRHGNRNERAVGRRGSRNHLATIYADGNRVGALFAAIAGHADNADALPKHSAETLTGATLDAFVVAGRNATGDARVEGVVKHVLGGDDVLVSVPAPLAWRFVRDLMTEFQSGVRTLGIEEPALRDLVEQLSLGVGMVFAHYSHPFAETQGLAHTAMRQAKEAVRGRSSAVVWHDLTAEERPPKTRWLSLGDLSADLAGGTTPESKARMQLLTESTASRRSQLAGTLRRFAEADTNVAVSEVRRWAQRNEAQLPVVFDERVNSDPSRLDLTDLADLLSRARWWPRGETS